jgi:hypothetical protein
MAKRDAFLIDADPTTNLPSYSGLEVRGILNSFQPGVIGSGDFKVTAGAGLTVDSAAGRATVQASAGGVTFGGLYYCVDDASENSATFERTGGGTGIPANASTNPRLDAVVLHVFDHSLDSSGRRAWVREYVPGTATGGAALGGTLPSLPTNSLLTAEVLVPANNPATIPSGNIRDRRPWARGALRAITRTGGAYSTTSTTPVPIDATNLSPRIECSGGPIRFSLSGLAAVSANPGLGFLAMNMDGGPINGVTDLGRPQEAFASGVAGGFSWTYVATPTAGSHGFAPTFYAASGQTVTLAASAAQPLTFVVDELVRVNADNT